MSLPTMRKSMSSLRGVARAPGALGIGGGRCSCGAAGRSSPTSAIGRQPVKPSRQQKWAGCCCAYCCAALSSNGPMRSPLPEWKYQLVMWSPCPCAESSAQTSSWTDAATRAAGHDAGRLAGAAPYGCMISADGAMRAR
jgi:hypothetical protein